uniref:Uncharacterized protein n=1 Tax=Romanomermis culicivorax TaxID=13658 RepID=A0A915IR84_ROMCU
MDFIGNGQAKMQHADEKTISSVFCACKLEHNKLVLTSNRLHTDKNCTELIERIREVQLENHMTRFVDDKTRLNNLMSLVIYSKPPFFR